MPYLSACSLILQVPGMEVLALHRRLNWTEAWLAVKIGNFISRTKSASAFVCIQRSVGRTEQAFDTEAAFGSSGIAPEGNGCGTLQPTLDPVHPAAQAFFPLRTCRSSCRRVKNSTSFWRGNGQELNLPDCVGL